MDADSEVQRRLTELEAASDERRRELSDVMQSLPAEVSRREVVRDSLSDLRVDSIVALARRALRAIGEVPPRAIGWVRTSLRR